MHRPTRIALLLLSIGCRKDPETTGAPASNTTTATTTSVPSTSASNNTSPSASTSSSSHPSAQKCPADDLASCKSDGCADPGSPHALFNNYKRRITDAKGNPITFESATVVTHAILKSLQAEADKLVGQKKDLDAPQRAKIASIQVGNLKLGEGSPVRLLGYLAPHKGNNASGTHPGGVESVNCKLDRDEWKDIHIPFLEKVDDDECHGVVVEMIPQGREQHPKWTTPELRKIAPDTKVLFVGPLFYDNEHEVHADCNTTSTQPKRMSLWEVHPVIELYTCTTGQCDAANKTGWQKVD